MGGAPGTRETDLLAPEQTVGAIDAVVLSGGSAFGLDAATGVMPALAASRPRLRHRHARGCRSSRPPSSSTSSTAATRTGAARSPYAAARPRRASTPPRSTSRSAPPAPATGATTVNLKGGLGSASMRLDDGVTVARAGRGQCASARRPSATTAHFWAAPFERDGEFGGLGPPPAYPAAATALRYKGQVERAEHDHRRRRHRRPADQGGGQAASPSMTP